MEIKLNHSAKSQFNKEGYYLARGLFKKDVGVFEKEFDKIILQLKKVVKTSMPDGEVS